MGTFWWSWGVFGICEANLYSAGRRKRGLGGSYKNSGEKGSESVWMHRIVIRVWGVGAHSRSAFLGKKAYL